MSLEFGVEHYINKSLTIVGTKTQNSKHLTQNKKYAGNYSSGKYSQKLLPRKK